MAADSARAGLGPAALARGFGYFAIWTVIAGTDPVDLAIGVPTAMAAAWTSLLLLPPGTGRVRLGPLARLLLRFPIQSIVAGIDVARRAFDPRLPLFPGSISFRTGFPPGPQRSAFETWLSLVPGTLPSGTDSTGAMSIHCLDLRLTTTAAVAGEEAWLQNIVDDRPSDD